MRIILRNEQQKEKQVLIPNGLLLNRLAAALTGRMLNKRGIHLSGNQIQKLMQDFKTVHKRHPDWVLLEMEDASGEGIKIII